MEENDLSKGGSSMILSYVWVAMVAFSLLAGFLTDSAGAISAAAMEGAKSGVELTVAMAGALCLWTGLSRVMEKSGITGFLSRLFRPILGRIFPETKKDEIAMGYLSSNFTANLLGLGNAATPLGISAVRRMHRLSQTNEATDEMCRLIVLNTASIQLIPSTVASIRASLGCQTPFDILPAVWLTSLLSAGAGVFVAVLWGKRHV